MKTKTTFLNLFSLVFLFLFLGNIQKVLYAQGGISQPTTSRYMPSTDPNLNPNWDWTAVTPGHTLYYEKDGRVLSTVRQLPFYTAGHPLNTLEKDMYPQDGWMLVYKDFGTATAAPDIPFFGLYNKYRGILRLMFFNTQQLTYSRFNIELSFMSTSATGAYLTFSDEVRAFRNDYDKARVENFMAEANSYNGWIYADFTVFGFDNLPSSDARFRVHIRGMNTSNVTLESTQFTLSEVLRDANPGPALNGGDLLGAANKSKKFFSDVSKASKSLREEAEKSTNTNKWWSNQIKSVLGTIAKPTNIVSIAPVVGGLVGLVTSFIGGISDPAPRQPLNFEGSLKMNGTITLSQPLYSVDLGLSYITGGNPPDYYRPIRSIYWGIFNLITIPVLDVYTGTDCPFGERYCDYYTYYNFKSPISYVFNTNVGLKIISIKYASVFTGQKPSSFSTSTPYVNVRETGKSIPYPTKIAVELTLKTTTPTKYFDDDIVIYKVYPVKINRLSALPNSRLASVKKVKLSAYPNSFTDKTAINLDLPHEQYVEGAIYNLSGRQIARVANRQKYPSGQHAFYWDGKNSSGKPVPKGIYLCRFFYGSEERTIRIVKE